MCVCMRERLRLHVRVCVRVCVCVQALVYLPLPHYHTTPLHAHLSTRSSKVLRPRSSKYAAWGSTTPPMIWWNLRTCESKHEKCCVQACVMWCVPVVPVPASL